MYEVSYGPVLIKKVLAGTTGLEEVVTLPFIGSTANPAVTAVESKNVATLDEIIISLGIEDEVNRLAAPPAFKVFGRSILTKDKQLLIDGSTVHIQLAYPKVVYSENSAEHNLYKKLYELNNKPVAVPTSSAMSIAKEYPVETVKTLPATAEDFFKQWDPKNPTAILSSAAITESVVHRPTHEEPAFEKAEEAFKKWSTVSHN